MAYFLEMKSICKSYTGVRANHNINFSVEKGEIHALLGENGAGKSTLMNILYGLTNPTSGEIYFRGEKTTISGPDKAIQLGIGMVHQHFMLIPALTAVENIILGHKGKKLKKLDLNEAAKKLKALSEQYGFKIDPFAYVWQMSVGQQQRLEILKALYRNAELFIFDEPTAVLTPGETEELFHMIDLLVNQGKTVIFISHKLHEVMRICQRVTILNGGEVVATVETNQTSQEELARLMVGKEMEKAKSHLNPAFSEDNPVVLSLEGVECNNTKNMKALKEVSFHICSGEILGICGVDGNGQSELASCIAGLEKVTKGKIFINGKDMTNAKPLKILQNGLAHIPEDRHKSGIVLQMNLCENILLMNYYRENFVNGEFLNWPYIYRYTDELLTKYGVKTPDSSEIIKNLSGGNQQKVVLGREISREPSLLLAVHPARGLDIGATGFVHKMILQERNRGAAVLLVSTELEELLALSDRIAVFYEGEIMGIVPPDTDIGKIGLMMAGTKWEEI